MSEVRARFVAALGYSFRDPALLELALTHRSASGGRNNERLEFLGDAVLGLLVAEQLYARFPKEDEGRLTRLRAALVKETTLAQVARELKLGDQLKLGPGELKSGGYRRDSILADAVEALLAAIYLDAHHDLEPCRQAVLRWYGGRFEHAASLVHQLKDPKSRLQEWLQARRLSLPQYEVVAVTGEAHEQVFTVQCQVEGQAVTVGRGASRRIAEQEAAAQVLSQLEQMK